MATRGMDSVIQHLRRAALLQAGTGITDGQLLESFVANQDSAAFEALVRRHGRMVQGVCLRVLRNRHDAEDAFQATFLVLAHKAARVVPREMVGNWLYGVAHTTALRAKAKAAKRLLRERQVANMRETNDAGAGQWDDLQVLLDEELTKLPDKYRLPVVLCDLEGRSRREVARQLKIPEGTLSSRLTTARQTLAKRLSRRGLALSSATMAVLLTQNASSGYVAPALVAATVKAAALLTAGQAVATSVISVSVIALKEGVLKAMLISKLKSAISLLIMVAAVGLGGGLVAQRSGSAEEPQRLGEKSKNADGIKPSPVDPLDDQTANRTLEDASAIALKNPTRNLTLEEAFAIALKNKSAVEAQNMAADASQAKADNAVQKRAEFKRQMHNLRLNVELAYWNLYETYGALHANEEVLRGLHKVWMDNLPKAQAEKVDSSILAQIRGQYEEFRRERTNSWKSVLEAERNLRGIMGSPVEDGKRLVPVTAPSLVRVEQKWEDVLKDALEKRPELELARENVLQRALALAREKIAPGSTPASLKTHRLQVAQAEHVLIDQEDRVKRSLTLQYQGVNKWYRLIEDRRAEREAYAQALTKKFDQVQTGNKSVDLDLLDVQRRLALAATKECQAIAEYNNSLARLEFARGTILPGLDTMLDTGGIRAVLDTILDTGGVRAVGYKEQTTRSPLLQRAPVAANAVHLKTAQFEADCKSLTSAGNPERIILVGDVHLISNKNGQTVRIEGQRVVLNLCDGTYTVDSPRDRE